MNLLECLVGIAISLILLAPLLKNSSDLIAKQMEYEKVQLLTQDADRGLELIGRSIRMAGYRRTETFLHPSGNKLNKSKTSKPLVRAGEFIRIQKSVGYRNSDSLLVQHEISQGIDFDCIGNTLSSDRTKNYLAQQGFLVERQATAPKGARVNGGSLICQSLDRQGRLQNTTLMNGVNRLLIEAQADSLDKVFKVTLEMTDGGLIHRKFERHFFARNLK
jgi:hypothetical protein